MLLDVGLHVPAEWDTCGRKADKIFQLDTFVRPKTVTTQPIAIFPHFNTFLMDWYFLKGYSLALRTESDNQECLFPGFFEHSEKDAEAKQTGDNSKSETSNYFKLLFKAVMELVDQLEDSFDNEEEQEALFWQMGMSSLRPNSKITSHAGKRYAVELANQNPMIKTTWVCFHAGWRMKMVSAMQCNVIGNVDAIDVISQSMQSD